MGAFREQAEPTRADYEQARHDIKQAEWFVETMMRGLRTFSLFDDAVTREVKIATLAKMIADWSDEGGAALIGAVGIMLLVEKGVFSE